MDEYLTPMEWRERALRAERMLTGALDCLRRLGSEAVPEPWRSVAQCAYMGCGGEIKPDSANGDDK